jgi:hypothetical protein
VEATPAAAKSNDDAALVGELGSRTFHTFPRPRP